MTYDLVVIGGGPGGERAAILASRHGKRVALVEEFSVVGGARVNWGTIPSKTLRESALFVHGLTLRRLDAIRARLPGHITIPEFMHRERLVVRRELESSQKSLASHGVEVIRGRGRLAGPGRVAVSDRKGRVTRSLTAPVIIIAVGAVPSHPQGIPFDASRVFDSNTILRLKAMPRSMTVIGAGVIGVEYASIFAAMGIKVALLDTRDSFLPYLDREVAAILLSELERMGIRFIPSARAEDISPFAKSVTCRLQDGRRISSDILLYCVGRDGNTADLGLETVGIRPTDRGLIKVDKDYRTTAPGVYAVGDVIGYPALANTSMEQGRLAVRHAFGIPGPHARTDQFPLALYAIPEVSTIGPTEEDLKREGTAFVVGRGLFGHNSRGRIMGAEGGLLKLLFDAKTLRLLGVHIVGPGASELIHIGQAFLASRTDAKAIAETIFNYPTLGDLYRHAALEALGSSGRA
ncbi:MAG: Si-specific NAD(P)(+) transhydrogenase [Elusimicrobiota bacterium]|jgi:NAD(P) transhydrogenase